MEEIVEKINLKRVGTINPELVRLSKILENSKSNEETKLTILKFEKDLGPRWLYTFKIHYEDKRDWSTGKVNTVPKDIYFANIVFLY